MTANCSGATTAWNRPSPGRRGTGPARCAEADRRGGAGGRAPVGLEAGRFSARFPDPPLPGPPHELRVTEPRPPATSSSPPPASPPASRLPGRALAQGYGQAFKVDNDEGRPVAEHAPARRDRRRDPGPARRDLCRTGRCRDDPVRVLRLQLSLLPEGGGRHGLPQRERSRRCESAWSTIRSWRCSRRRPPRSPWRSSASSARPPPGASTGRCSPSPARSTGPAPSRPPPSSAYQPPRSRASPTARRCASP